MGEKGRSHPRLTAGLLPDLLQGEAETEEALLQFLLPEDSTIRGLNNLLFRVSGSTKASILWHSAFFIVQLSHPYMPTGKTIALTSIDKYGPLLISI